jgi:hypothetical protein
VNKESNIDRAEGRTEAGGSLCNQYCEAIQKCGKNLACVDDCKIKADEPCTDEYNLALTCVLENEFRCDPLGTPIVPTCDDELVIAEKCHADRERLLDPCGAFCDELTAGGCVAEGCEASCNDYDRCITERDAAILCMLDLPRICAEDAQDMCASHWTRLDTCTAPADDTPADDDMLADDAPGGDAECAALADFSSCDECCQGLHPAGNDAWNAAFEDCYCSMCGTECGSQFCGTQTGSATECDTCTSNCSQIIGDACDANGNCAIYAECYLACPDD